MEWKVGSGNEAQSHVTFARKNLTLLPRGLSWWLATAQTAARIIAERFILYMLHSLTTRRSGQVGRNPRSSKERSVSV